jgi:hypothetical protein
MALSALMTDTDSDRPAIIVHGLDDALAACAAAAERGRAVRLFSAVNAAAYGGPGWFTAVIDAARARYPQAVVEPVLDCGDAPGHALAALRHGVAAIAFDGSARAAQKIAAIAAARGVAVIARPQKALDAAACRDAPAACRAWLDRV